MSEFYTEIGRWIVWLTCIGFFILCLSAAAVLFDSWVLRPRREAIMKAASIQAAQNITRDSYWFSEHPPTAWFSEHPPTAFLIRELSKEGQGHTIDHIRQLWQKEMEKHEQSRPQSETGNIDWKTVEARLNGDPRNYDYFAILANDVEAVD